MEKLEILDVEERGALFVVRSDDGGLRIVARDPHLAPGLACAMDGHRKRLAALV